MNFKYLQLSMIFSACMFFAAVGMSNTDLDLESNILIQFNEPYTTCYDQQVQITPTVTGGAGGYSYQWSNGDIGTSTNGPQFPGSLVYGTYQYILTVTDAVGCSGVGFVSYTIHQEVSHTLFADSSFGCIDGQDDNINVCAQIATGQQNSPLTYNWVTNPDLEFTANNNCIVIDEENSQDGLYTINLEVTDFFGCTYMDGPFFFTIEQSPDIEIVAQQCNSNGAGEVEYFIEVCDDSQAQTQWNLYDENCSILLDGPFGGNCTTFIVAPFELGDDMPVSFCVLAENQSSGCTAVQSFTLEPPKIPQVPLSIDGCLGETVDITLGNPEDFELWQWCDGVSSDTSFQITITENEFCFFTVVDYNGCEQVYEIEVNTPFEEDVFIFGDTQFCLGGSTTLCATSNPDYQYNWSTGETTECITILAAGNYSVEVILDDCSFQSSIQVSEISELEPIILGSDLCLGDSTILSTANNYTSYEWTNSNGEVIDPSNEMAPWQIEITEAGTYTVSVSDGACDGETQIVVDGIEPSAASVEDAFVCNNIESGQSTILDLTTFVIDAPGAFTILDPTGGSNPAHAYDFVGFDPGIYPFEVIVHGIGPCPDQVLNLLVEVSECVVSVQDLVPLNISVFPNPTQDLLIIDSEETEFNYQVLSLTGNILEEGNARDREIQFEQMEAGVYFVKFMKEERTQIVRVVKM